MQWDLGLQGIGALLLMAAAFGAFAQILFWRKSMWWVGVVATAAFFVLGIVISEVLFGWATEKDLQPNIDGLSFDETLLGYLVAVPAAILAWYLMRRRSSKPAA